MMESTQVKRLPTGYTPGHWRYDNSPRLYDIAEAFDRNPGAEFIGFKQVSQGPTALDSDSTGLWLISRRELLERLKQEGLICP